MFKTIAGIELVQSVDPILLGWIDEERAATEGGLLENHDYVDLRGFGFDEVEDVYAHEAEIFDRISMGIDDKEFDDLIVEFDETYFLPLEVGIVSGVLAVSALGCVPITSCRGNTLHDRHRFDAPTILFYARPEHLATLLVAARAAGVSIVNNNDKVELYSDDIRKIHAFALAIIKDVKS